MKISTQTKHRIQRSNVRSLEGIKSGLQDTFQTRDSKGFLGDLLYEEDAFETFQDPEVNGFFQLSLEQSTPSSEVKQVFGLLEKAMKDPKVKIAHREPMGGGINKTELVQLSNGLAGIWKPDEGASGLQIHSNIPSDGEAGRDIAAYWVDKQLDHLARIPPVVVRKFEGKKGVLSFYLEDASTARKEPKLAGGVLFDEDTSKRYPLTVLDNAIGNLDRHSGNWMIGHFGHAIPIDHGLSFPTRNGKQPRGGGYAFSAEVPLRPETSQKLAAMVEDEVALKKKLEPLVGVDATGAFLRRVKDMVKHNKAGSDWLGETRIWKQRPTRMGYIKNHFYPIQELECLGKSEVRSLKADGIVDTGDLLHRYGKKSQRDNFQEKRNLDSNKLLDALNEADLMRVEGVGGVYAHLLHDAGVDSVPELAQRNPETLADLLKKLNDEEKQVSRVPGTGEVKEWVKTARLMTPRVKH